MWLLHAFGLIDGAAHLIVFSLEDRLFLRPHGKDHLHRLAQMTQAIGRIGIVVSVGAILVFEPARTNPEVQSSVREDIYCTGHFSKERGIAIAIAGDHLANADTAGIARNGRGGGPALKSHFL